MSRLFYEDEFRVLDRVDAPRSDTKKYMDKVASLIPAEIVAAFMTLKGLAITVTGYESTALIVSFVICLILTPLYLNFMAESEKPKVKHIVISTISFVVWAYVISGDTFANYFKIFYHGAAASMLIIVYSLAVGLVKLDK